MTTPSEVWDYNLDHRGRTLRKRQEIPSGHDPAAYVTRRLFAPGFDGETIPISLLHHKDTPIDGTAPALVYGYGAYGIAIPAAFSSNRLSLVDRGFVFAIAHVRGGTEKGWRWYRAGKLANKPNTFRRFHRGRGVPDRQALGGAHEGDRPGRFGRRNADGCRRQQRPDLFAGIIAEVPFVDVLNTMLDDTLPLTPPEWPEWGNPRTDRGCLPHDPKLRPLRQRSGAALSRDAGVCRPDRSAGHLLGTGEMGRSAARAAGLIAICWRCAPISMPDTPARPDVSIDLRRSRWPTRLPSRSRDLKRSRSAPRTRPAGWPAADAQVKRVPARSAVLLEVHTQFFNRREPHHAFG